ncbi:hypothetical protein GF389_04995 [Candidatus Dojkabacteria bacterium]|nr:hypothetical protein [Candidatus Dojkabacteria bacterium]
MKDRFFYITVVVFLVTLLVTGFLYYRLSQVSVIEYDNQFIDTRNEIIIQIDTLSNTLNNAEEVEIIDTEINSLSEKYSSMEEIYSSTREPNTNGEEIIAANKAFLEKTQEIINTAEAYKQSFSDDNVDPVEKMNEYNQKVEQLNTIIEEIKRIIEEYDSNPLANLFRF